jgi:hypothetical protein
VLPAAGELAATAMQLFMCSSSWVSCLAHTLDVLMAILHQAWNSMMEPSTVQEPLSMLAAHNGLANPDDVLCRAGQFTVLICEARVVWPHALHHAESCCAVLCCVGGPPVAFHAAAPAAWSRCCRPVTPPGSSAQHGHRHR